MDFLPESMTRHPETISGNIKDKISEVIGDNNSQCSEKSQDICCDPLMITDSIDWTKSVLEDLDDNKNNKNIYSKDENKSPKKNIDNELKSSNEGKISEESIPEKAKLRGSVVQSDGKLVVPTIIEKINVEEGNLGANNNQKSTRKCNLIGSSTVFLSTLSSTLTSQGYMSTPSKSSSSKNETPSSATPKLMFSASSTSSSKSSSGSSKKDISSPVSSYNKVSSPSSVSSKSSTRSISKMFNLEEESSECDNYLIGSIEEFLDSEKDMMRKLKTIKEARGITINTVDSKYSTPKSSYSLNTDNTWKSEVYLKDFEDEMKSSRRSSKSNTSNRDNREKTENENNNKEKDDKEKDSKETKDRKEEQKQKPDNREQDKDNEQIIGNKKTREETEKINTNQSIREVKVNRVDEKVYLYSTTGDVDGVQMSSRKVPPMTSRSSRNEQTSISVNQQIINERPTFNGTEEIPVISIVTEREREVPIIPLVREREVPITQVVTERDIPIIPHIPHMVPTVNRSEYFSTIRPNNTIWAGIWSQTARENTSRSDNSKGYNSIHTIREEEDNNNNKDNKENNGNGNSNNTNNNIKDKKSEFNNNYAKENSINKDIKEIGNNKKEYNQNNNKRNDKENYKNNRKVKVVRQRPNNGEGGSTFNNMCRELKCKIVKVAWILVILFWILSMLTGYKSITSEEWMVNEIKYKKGDIEGKSVTMIGTTGISRSDVAFLKDGAELQLSRGFMSYKDIIGEEDEKEEEGDKDENNNIKEDKDNEDSSKEEGKGSKDKDKEGKKEEDTKEGDETPKDKKDKDKEQEKDSKETKDKKEEQKQKQDNRDKDKDKKLRDITEEEKNKRIMEIGLKVDKKLKYYVKCLHETKFVKKSSCFRHLCEVGNLNQADTMYFKLLYGPTFYDLHFKELPDLMDGGKKIKGLGIFSLVLLGIAMIMMLEMLYKDKMDIITKIKMRNIGNIFLILNILTSVLGLYLWSTVARRSICVGEDGMSRPCDKARASKLYIMYIVFSVLTLIFYIVNSVANQPDNNGSNSKENIDDKENNNKRNEKENKNNEKEKDEKGETKEDKENYKNKEQDNITGVIEIGRLEDKKTVSLLDEPDV